MHSATQKAPHRRQFVSIKKKKCICMTTFHEFLIKHPPFLFRVNARVPFWVEDAVA